MRTRSRPTPLEAMIRGKAAGLDGQEDPLTALVFGLMAWVPPSLGLEPLLAGAVDDHRRPLGWGQELSDVSIDFWPWWDEHDHVDGAEPDAVLTWTRGGRRELLVVEAKWKAGKSGTGERDQLMRQYANARILADQEHLFFRGLLYVTAGVTVPVSDLRASREALQRAGTDRLGDDVNLGWVSWRDLPPILTRAASELTATDPLVARLAEDTREWLLRHGLDRFRGLSEVLPVPGLVFDRGLGPSVPVVVPPLSAFWMTP